MSEEAQGRDGRGPSGDESTIERAAGLAPRGRDASQRAVHFFFNTNSKSYGRRRVLGGAAGALGALPGGGASGVDEGVGDSERRWRRGARKRGTQRRGGGGEVRSDAQRRGERRNW